MEYPELAMLYSLSPSQKAALKRGNIVTVIDLFLWSIADIARKCKLASPKDAQFIIEVVSRELVKKPVPIDDPSIEDSVAFTTGDHILDQAIGGGLRTGMVWEIVGESAAGKSQLAFQLSLSVQLPIAHGGIGGAACMMCTSRTLPTERLLEIIDEHPMFSPNLCNLSDIQTLKVPTVDTLRHILSQGFPAFVKKTSSRPGCKPIKLLIIDTLTELFHEEEKTSSSTLSRRSKDLAEISTLLHIIASKYGMAVVVLNEVADAFNHVVTDYGKEGEVLYRDQVRLFARGDSVPGENRKEAALGLVWANQVNARIMLSRTNRSYYPEEIPLDRPNKRRKVDESLDINASSSSETKRILLRRLSVLFNSVAPPISLDYIVTKQGIQVIENDEDQASITVVPPITLPDAEAPASSFKTIPSSSELPMHEESFGDDNDQLEPHAEAVNAEGPLSETDEWDEFWAKDSNEDLYNNIDIDALSSSYLSTL
ncbi:P-loop containing nucleoside triphosphate hydrolase protein [Abortiporus biennis]|nr:P-loop containing nucleoside triphosphate hydrolase protein [Abortiporus biennis]